MAASETLTMVGRIIIASITDAVRIPFPLVPVSVCTTGTMTIRAKNP